MAYKTLTLEIADDVALIRLNRPEALNPERRLFHALFAAEAQKRRHGRLSGKTPTAIS